MALIKNKKIKIISTINNNLLIKYKTIKDVIAKNRFIIVLIITSDTISCRLLSSITLVMISPDDLFLTTLEGRLKNLLKNSVFNL